MDPIKDSQGSIESDVIPPDRSSSSSAPPALQLASESLFAWKVEYAKIFSDIRAHEDYFNFYEHFKEEKRGLPPPLDPTGFLFEFDEDMNKQKTMYVQPGSSYDSNDIQQSMQNMKLNTKPPYGGVDIPTPNNASQVGGTPVWNPVPRQGRKNMGFTESFEETNLLLNRMAEKFDLAYSSSPSAQTAVGAVNYIWKDEEPSSNTNNNNSSASSSSSNATGTATFGFFNSGASTNISSNTSSITSPIKKDTTSEEATSPTKSNVVCRYYASGYCSRGDKCFYSHDLNQKHAILSPIEEDREDQPIPQKLDNSTIQTPVAMNAVNNSISSTSSSSSATTSNVTTPTKNEGSSKNNSNKKNNVSANSSSNSVGSSSSKGNNSTGASTKNNSNRNSNNSSSNNSGVSTNGGSTSKSTSPTPMSMNNANAAALEAPVSPRSQEYNFETLIGRIYHVCKDQQGCRFLQKKLEENEPKVTEVIFNEVYDHISELMIDPFGNYLCQKILEHCNDHQRFLVVQKVASELVQISKNMHGTRAVQKMIECLSSPSQIELVKRALCNSVVELIQDLNGNHVIQRCLNRLSPEDNQFIYDAVTSGNNCVEVATHRHGCCVLQRCIDHASTKQKIQLIHEITKNALVLVQDAYGNYVVQYILDLPFPNLVDSLAKSFVGNIRILTTQKFSSNVVEKCLQSCSPDVRYVLVKEILGEKHHFLQLLQDPFANYVIQTALTTSEPQQHHDLIEAIKPFMNQLRNTPYGKRIQSKLTKDSHHSESKHHKHR